MKILKHWLLLSVLLCVSAVQAADPLLISGGSDRAIPIAVVPFGWQGASALPEDLGPDNRLMTCVTRALFSPLHNKI